MLRRYLVFSVLGFLFPFFLAAQDLKSYLKSAQVASQEQNYFGAAFFYEKALEIDSNSIKTTFLCADAHRLDYNFQKAISMYLSVLQRDTLNFPLTSFYLGECYTYLGKYKQAYHYYSKYYQQKQDSSFYTQKSYYTSKVCKALIDSTIVSQKMNVELLPPTINTDNCEFGTFVNNDTVLYFSAFRDKTIQIYESHWEKNTWKSPQSIGTLLNDSTYHVSNFCLSPSAKTLFFTRSSRQKSQTVIFSSQKKDGQWQSPQALSGNINAGTITTQAFAVRMQNTDYLLFVSDRVGGFGKLDIWYAKLNADGSLDEAKNIGSTINSIDDDITPFYADSTLYFASKWYNNLGGFDIFSSKGTFEHWQNPQNVGKPINSSYNDLYFYSTPKNRAFFTSNRPTKPNSTAATCNDIYTYTLKVDTITKKDSIPVLISTKKIIPTPLRSKNFIPKDSIPLRLQEFVVFFDNDQPLPHSRTKTVNSSYDSLYYVYNQQFSTYKMQNLLHQPDSLKDSIETSVKQFFSSVEQGYENLVMVCQQLEYFVQNKYSVTVEMNGSASPLHSSKYNENLSQRRIVCVLNFMKNYHNGILNDTCIVWKTNALGKKNANAKVSDKLSDKQKSVYHPLAARERKVTLKIINLKKLP